jgi:hypothetical protein
MQLGAGVSFLTVAHASECFTVQRGRIEANMSEATIIVVASAMLEMEACGRIVR